MALNTGANLSLEAAKHSSLPHQFLRQLGHVAHLVLQLCQGRCLGLHRLMTRNAGLELSSEVHNHTLHRESCVAVTPLGSGAHSHRYWGGWGRGGEGGVAGVGVGVGVWEGRGAERSLRLALLALAETGGRACAADMLWPNGIHGMTMHAARKCVFVGGRGGGAVHG